MHDYLITGPVLLALVLGLAAATKWRDRGALVAASRLLRLPEFMVRRVQWLPVAEAVLALALLVTPWWPVLLAVSIAAMGLMLAYVVIIARGLRIDPRPSCACFGEVGAPIAEFTLIRNIVFVALSLVSVFFAASRQTLPGVIWYAEPVTWGWLVALAVAAIVAAILGAEMQPGLPASIPLDGLRESAVEPEGPDEGDYVRLPIPPAFVLQDGNPVSLRQLAVSRPQLLIWIACGCGRSEDVLAVVHRLVPQMPKVEVKYISVMTEAATTAHFPGIDWLYDPNGQVLVSLGIQQDPVGLLLGADGLLAGGPAQGVSEVTEMCEMVVEELRQASETGYES